MRQHHSQLLANWYVLSHVHLILKNSNKKLDTFAQDFNFNWLTENEVVNDGIRTPLKSHIDEVFADWLIGHTRVFLQSYKDLMLNTNADVLKREDTLQLLINEFFVPEVFSMLKDAEEKFDFPYTQCLVNKDKTNFSLVLQSFSQEQDYLQKIEHSYANNFAPDRNGSDRRVIRLEQFRDWLKGKNILDLVSLKLLANTIAKHSQKDKINIIQCLILARALDWIFAEMNKHNFTLDLSKSVILGNQADVRISLEKLIFSKTPVTTNVKPALEFLISKFKDYKNPKLTGDSALFKRALTDSQEIILNEPNLYCGQYMIDLFYGRFYVMQGEPDVALKFYESSFKHSLYRAGIIQIEILKELLTTAAYLTDKPCLKKHKAWGLAFNIYPKDKFSQEVIDDWEIKELTKYFYEIFPRECLFQEVGDCYEHPVSVLGVDIIYIPNLENQTLNLRSPNKKVSFGNKSAPQLVAQAVLGDFDNVKKLLENGADVNKIDFDSGGGSALLNALQTANRTYLEKDISLVVELLKYRHTKETLNRVTERKRLSILFEAIRLGKPDVVETILDMGADPNLRAEMDNQSPLDLCIQQLFALSNKDFWKNLSSQEVDQVGLARITGRFASQMFEKELIPLSERINQYPEISKSLVEYFDENHKQKHSESSLYEIAHLLLINGANPNSGNTKNYGVTPLMFAAEVKHSPMFNLLLKYKGDLHQPNSKGRCALDYWEYGVS
jgi:ankyrin repeat protein